MACYAETFTFIAVTVNGLRLVTLLVRGLQSKQLLHSNQEEE